MQKKCANIVVFMKITHLLMSTRSFTLRCLHRQLSFYTFGCFLCLPYDDLTQFFMNTLLIKLIATLLQRKPIISVHPLRPVFNYRLFISAVLIANIADGVFVCPAVCPQRHKYQTINSHNFK